MKAGDKIIIRYKTRWRDEYVIGILLFKGMTKCIVQYCPPYQINTITDAVNKSNCIEYSEMAKLLYIK